MRFVGLVCFVESWSDMHQLTKVASSGESVHFEAGRMPTITDKNVNWTLALKRFNLTALLTMGRYSHPFLAKIPNLEDNAKIVTLLPFRRRFFGWSFFSLLFLAVSAGAQTTRYPPDGDQIPGPDCLIPVKASAGQQKICTAEDYKAWLEDITH